MWPSPLYNSSDQLGNAAYGTLSSPPRNAKSSCTNLLLSTTDRRTYTSVVPIKMMTCLDKPSAYFDNCNWSP